MNLTLPPELLDAPTGCANATLALQSIAEDEFSECAEPFRAWLASHELTMAQRTYIVATIRAQGCPNSGHAAQRLAAATQNLREEFVAYRLENFSDMDMHVGRGGKMNIVDQIEILHHCANEAWLRQHYEAACKRFEGDDAALWAIREATCAAKERFEALA